MPADAGPAAAQTPARYADADAARADNAGTNDTEDGVIAGERAHLRRSREFLHLMRENVLLLAQNPMAGDRVSLEYLKADLYRRAEALKDLPDTPLFFGRLDYAAGAAEPGGPPGEAVPRGETFHIGRRHVHDPGGHPVVIDWRAPVSRPFSRASRAAPMELDRRRRFGFAGGELTAYEDEDFPGAPTAAAGQAAPGAAAAPGG